MSISVQKTPTKIKEEEKIKKRKREEVAKYKRGDAKKRHEQEKAQGKEYDRKTRKWVKKSMNAQGKIKFMLFHRIEGVLKEILRMDEQEE